MSEFSFTLALDVKTLTDAQISSLYSTVPDSTASDRSLQTYVAFDREAKDFASAVVSAIEDVEQALPGVTVLAVEPEELVIQAEIALRTSRSRESISQLVHGERGPGDFPRPQHIVGGRSFWRWQDVQSWFDKYERRQEQAHHDAFIDAVNAVLAVRHSRPALGARELDAVRRLVKDSDLIPA